LVISQSEERSQNRADRAARDVSSRHYESCQHSKEEPCMRKVSGWANRREAPRPESSSTASRWPARATPAWRQNREWQDPKLRRWRVRFFLVEITASRTARRVLCVTSRLGSRSSNEAERNTSAGSYPDPFASCSSRLSLRATGSLGAQMRVLSAESHG